MSKQLTLTKSTPIPDVLAALEKEFKELKTIQETAYKTNGEAGSGFTNLQQETNIENLIRLGSVIKAKEKYYVEYAENTLGMSKYPAFQHNGFPSSAWDEDIKLKMAIIQHKERYDLLSSLKQKAEKFLSEEDQKAMLMQELSKALNL